MRKANVVEKDSLFEQRRYYFKNGYGASVVKGLCTFGAEQGLWELAVVKCSKEGWLICYDTPITDDVIGYLTEEAVDALLEEIAKLPKGETCLTNSGKA